MTRGMDHNSREKLMKMPFLAQDLIVKILVRLPINSLLRFRCVCKSWRNLTFNPNFIQEYHLLHLSKYSFFLRNYDFSQECYRNFFTWDDHPSQMMLETLDFPPRDLSIKAASAGLLCCELEDENPQWFVCNPATREIVELPSADTEYETYTMVMFAQLSKPCNFKVMRLCPHVPTYPDWNCQVFDSRCWAWTALKDIILDPGFVIEDKCSAFVNGAFHWTVWHAVEPNFFILAIHINDDNSIELTELPQPVAAAATIAESEGCLSLVNHSVDTVDVWVLNDYHSRVWAKKYVVNLGEFIEAPLDQVHIMAFLGEILVIEKSGELFMYYVKSGRLSKVAVENAVEHTGIIVFQYESTLLPCKNIV
ncbi:hypothetical protein AMTRI_Chr12g240150 [Amborella trichopoda]